MFFSSHIHTHVQIVHKIDNKTRSPRCSYGKEVRVERRPPFDQRCLICQRYYNKTDCVVRITGLRIPRENGSLSNMGGEAKAKGDARY